MVGAVVLVGGLIISSVTAWATMPSTFVTGEDPDELTTTAMKETLEDLGFTEVTHMLKDGKIIHTIAKWEGETVKIRIDAEMNSIVIDENPPPESAYGIIPE